jgi:capsular polysaccharide biosynthesis protein
MATRARVNPEPPAGDPPTPPTAVSCTCPVCKSVVAFEDGALTGGDPSAEYLGLEQRADAAHVLEGELAKANAKLAELEETAAGHDDPPAPKEKHFFI